MNEERLKTVWEYLGSQGEDVGDYNTFKSVVEETPTRMKKVHSYLESKGEDVGTYGQFMNALEFTPKKEAKAKGEGEEEVEELVLDLGSLNNTLVGDYLDDTYRAMLRGRKTGAAVNETLNMMIKGSSVTPENIANYVKAAKDLERYGQSDEFRGFIDAGGFETGKGWLELLKNPITIGSELMLESLTQMVANPVTGSIIAGGAASGAAMGGVGTLGTMPVAMGMASGVIESTSKFTEELNKELADRGLELNEENVTKLLEDEETMSKIKQKAALKGAVVGVIDGITGGISGRIGSKALKAGVRGGKKAKAVGKGLLVESIGGSGGELASQLVLGEPLDVTSIGLEAFAEIGSGSANVLLPYAQEAVRQNKLRKNLDGVALERHKTNKPFYSIVNDEGVEVKISKTQAEEIIEKDPEAFLTGDVKIANDLELSQKALERLTPVIEDQDKIKTLINERDKKEIRLGEEARKKSKKETTQEDGGVEVQGDIDPTVEVKQGAVEEGGERPVSKTTTNVSDTPATDGAKPVQKTKVEAKPERKLSDIEEKYKDSTVDVYEDNKRKTLSVGKIEVPEAKRGQGVGTNIMKDIIDYADNKGLKVTLTPTDEFGTSKTKLKKFYKGLGFVENKGENRDLSHKDDMYRNPEISNAVKDLKVDDEFTFTRPNGSKERAVYKGEGKWRLPDSGKKINENEFEGVDAPDDLNTLINQQILENGQTEILSDEQATSSTKGTTGTTTTDQSGDRGTINETTQTEEGGVSKPFVLTPDLNNVVKVGDDFYYTKEKRGSTPSKRKVEAENIKTAQKQFDIMDTYDKLVAQGEDVVKNFKGYTFPIVRRDGKFYTTGPNGKVYNKEAKLINTSYKKQQFENEVIKNKQKFNNQNNNNNETQQSKGQPVQQSGKNNERVETDNQKKSDQRGSDTERTELQENVDGGGKSPSTSAKAPDLTPEQKKNAEINEKIERAASRLEKKFGINITDEQLEKGFDSISDLRDPSMSVGSFKIAVQAALDKRIQDTYEANKKSFFARFKAENMPKKLQKVLRFIKREFRSSGPVPKQMNESISDARGGILKETHTAKILSDKLTRVSKKFSEADKLKLNELLQSIDAEVEFSDSVDADTAKEVRYLVSQMRSHIDRLIRKLRDLGIFDQVFSDVLTNSQGQYINRIYMKHIDPKWVDKIPVNVWEAAKKDIRAELTQALADGRVRAEKKKTFLEYLTNDNALDAYLSGMVTGSNAGIYKSGTIEGSKDVSILKVRKAISPIIREFYGEVKDVDLNYINTVTKISQFVYNHKMISNLQKVDDGTFFANSKRGPGWEQINKSESQSLLPFDKDTYMDGELYKHLEIQAQHLSEFTKMALRFNGMIKSGKTVYSPITQIRNLLSAFFWMMALGNNPINPKKWKNFTRAGEMIFDVKNFFLDADGNNLINSDGTFKQAANFGKKGKYNKPKFNVIRKAVSKALLNGDIKKSEIYGKNGSINPVVVEKYLEGRVKENVRLWNELTRLQVVNQSVFAREIAEDFFQVKKGQDLSEVIGNNTPGIFKKLIDKPLEIYSRVDDFYRVSVFMNERSDWSNIFYNKSIDDIIDDVDVKIEEGTNRKYFELNDSSNKIVTENGKAKKFYKDEMLSNIDRKAAVQVKNLYPNYSQTYPIIKRLKKTWLIGAFVSFSAEMWRTSYNQVRNVGELLRKDYNKKGIDVYDGEGNIENIKPLNSAAAKKKGIFAFTGLLAVGYITSNLARVLSRQFGFDDDEKDDILKDRAPWVETAILFEDRGDGRFRFVNPTSINPYGMFGDIGNAIKNEEGSTGKKFAAAIVKTLEPFLGLEISTEVISKSLLDYLDEDNPDTREEKLYTFINELYKGLQPGFSYTAERIISPKITKAEMEEDINALSKKRQSEILATLLGVRISELDTQLSFILNTGPKILKNEARARKLMSQAMYKDELTGVKLDNVYGRAAKIYDEYLVEARENASRLRRIGVSEKDLVKIHKQAKFDSRTSFSGAELEYILGKTNYKPKFEVNGYNKQSGGSSKINPTRRKTRKIGSESSRRNTR